MARRSRRFTIYDVMEENGVFASNPANMDSRAEDGSILYQGPVPFPRMVYRPDDLVEVARGEEVFSPVRGGMILGQRFEPRCTTAKDEAELEKLLAAGWKLHPSADFEPPAPDRTEELEGEIAELRAQLAAMQSPPVGGKGAGSAPAPKQLP